MGGKNKAPAAPDYSALAAASQKSAEYSFQLGKDQLAWAKSQYASDKGMIDKVVNAAVERSAVNDRNAASDRARYERIYQPLEDVAAKEALDYATPERTNLEMGRAQATVGQNFEAARNAATANLESYGVDPTSTRFAALDANSRIQEAAAKAGAGNNARTQTEAIGRALRSEAINVGRGYPGQVAGTYGTAIQSANSGVNSALAGTASGANTMGTGTQWTGMGQNGLMNTSNIQNAGYNSQLAQYNANQASSSGLGTLAGGVLGAAGGFAPLFAGFAKGGAVGEDVTPGGNIPPEASASRGKAIDDVPAMLTAGEFVVPKDVMAWKGEEFFQNMIKKSREAKPQAPAKAQYKAVPDQAPNFVSRPNAALPTG